jgi:hypothetical protein
MCLFEFILVEGARHLYNILNGGVSYKRLVTCGLVADARKSLQATLHRITMIISNTLLITGNIYNENSKLN